MLSIFFISGIKSWKYRKHPKRIAKIKVFIDKYIWDGIYYWAEKILEKMRKII